MQQDTDSQTHRHRQTDREAEVYTCTESFDDAGSGLHLIKCYWLYWVCHKLQLSSQRTMSSALRRWLNKLVEYITTVATTCVLRTTNHITSLHNKITALHQSDDFIANQIQLN